MPAWLVLIVLLGVTLGFGGVELYVEHRTRLRNEALGAEIPGETSAQKMDRIERIADQLDEHRHRDQAVQESLEKSLRKLATEKRKAKVA